MSLVRIALVFIFTILLQTSTVQATSYEVEIFATVPGCGDAVIQSGEQCDGSNLGGSSCSLQGFTSGSLSCSTVCTFVTTSCVLLPDNGSSGGRAATVEIKDVYTPATNLVVTGYAEPSMRVQLLVDGILVATTIADTEGQYQTTISGLSAGEYRLQVTGFSSYTEMRTQTETIKISIVANATTKLSHIMVPSTFILQYVDGQYSLRGQAAPGSKVIPVVASTPVPAQSTTVDATGVYEILITGLPNQMVTVQIKSPTHNNVSTGMAQSFSNAEQEAPDICVYGIDITNDCLVNLIDFQAARWIYIFNPASLRFDLDDNKKIDIVDFSIMAYYWTG